MKTAMQFLKDEIESKIIPSSRENGELSDYQYGHNIAYSVVLTLAQYLIEVEKKQMIDFYNWMRRNDSAEEYFHYSDEDMLEEYYNQKEEQKQHIIDIMKADEEDGLYNELNK